MQEELHFTLTFLFSFRDGSANVWHAFRRQDHREIESYAKYMIVAQLLLPSAFSVSDQWYCWYSGTSVWVGGGRGG